MRLQFTTDQLNRAFPRLGRLYADLADLNLKGDAATEEEYTIVQIRFFSDIEKIINNEPLDTDRKQ